MSNIEVIKELHDRQVLKPLVKAGLFPYKLMTYVEVYYFVDSRMKLGVHKNAAVIEAACEFNISERSVYRAIKSLT